MAVHFKNTVQSENEGCQHINMPLMDKELLRSSDSVSIDIDHGTITDTCPVEDKVVNNKEIEYDNNSSSDDFAVSLDASSRVKFAESSSRKTRNSNNISDYSTKTMNPGSIPKRNRKDSILQNEDTEDIVVSVTKEPSIGKRVKQFRSTSIDLIKRNSLCCKVSTTIGLCFAIGFSLMPIIVYYVAKIGENVIKDLEYSHDRNISSAKIILMKTCNFSDSDCVDQILYTYETLRTINLPSSQQYCSERVETLFCDALMECSNESYVKDIVCQQVRQEHCTAEWRMLEAHNQTDGLIDCEEYEETLPLYCDDQFDLASDGSVCLPLCGEFSQHSEAYTKPHNMMFATCLFMGIIGGVTIIAISIKKRKKMFHFPQVLVVINVGLVVIIDSLVFISTVSVVSGKNILCSGKFLFDALENPTTFCTIQGCLVTAGLVILSYFWLLYICHMALKIFYPMKSFKLINSDYSRTIYIAGFLLIIFIGAAPSVITGAYSNYKIVRFPPTQCGTTGAYRFYEIIVPVMISTTLSQILLLLTIYKIHMSHGIFKRKHRTSVDKCVCTCQFTVPEIKIVFVIAYWLVHSVLLWTSSSVVASRVNIFDYHLRSYADCMAGGNRKDHDCHRLRQDVEDGTNPVVEVIIFLSIAFLAIASLPFVVQFQTAKNSVRQLCCKKI